MKQYVYLDPSGGLAGDMFSGAFLDADIVSLSEFQAAVKAVIPDISLQAVSASNCGIGGKRLSVQTRGMEEKLGDSHRPHEPQHEHYPYKDIKKQLYEADLEPFVAERALVIFETLAQAEATVHGKSIDAIAFHEVGRNDAIADIVCAAVCMQKIKSATVCCGPLPFGIGEITFSHGTMTLPAPATLEILKGVPTTAGHPVGEMTTPTGAAIAVNCVDEFCVVPNMTTEKIGYGLGSREVKGYPNYLRVSIGSANSEVFDDLDCDEVFELKANVDDQPSHLLAPALDRLLEEGAIDVFITAYAGKKGRQGQQWTVLAHPEKRSSTAALMMQLLGSIGVRMTRHERLKLKREETQMTYKNHKLKAKRVYGAGIDRCYPEADAVHALAKQLNVSPLEVFQGVVGGQ